MEDITLMKGGGQSNGVATTVFEDCYHPALDFPKVLFEHSFREANSVAHELARMARDSIGQVWLDDPPHFLLPLLLNDVTIISNE
jgi:hypothetical protein